MVMLKKEIEMHFKLRPWLPTDVESLVRHANNPNIAKWLTNVFPHPYTEADGQSYIEMVRKATPATVFAIEIDGEAVGSIGVFKQTDVHEKNAEIGYWLSEKYWGNGVMPRAIAEICEYAFKTFDVVRLYARPFSTNVGSARVLEKAGFELEARLKNALYKNGAFMDELIYARWRSNV